MMLEFSYFCDTCTVAVSSTLSSIEVFVYLLIDLTFTLFASEAASRPSGITSSPSTV